MAGLIDQAQQAPAGRQVKADVVRGQMQVPPEQADTLDKIILAGKKLMFSEQLAPEIAQLLASDAPIGEKLGQGVLGLLALLMQRANGTLPPQLLIPAGVALVTEAADMLEEAGQKIEDNDVAEGMAVFIEQLLQKAGVDLAQAAQAVAQGAPQGAPQVPPQPEPAPLAPGA